jgi:hypothetical protein
MINIIDVGAAPLRDAAGALVLDAGGRPQVHFGLYLPGITFNKRQSVPARGPITRNEVSRFPYLFPTPGR